MISSDQETAFVLVQVGELTQKSDNRKAGKLFNAFTEELEKIEPKKSLLLTFWDGLTKQLPILTGIVLKV